MIETVLHLPSEYIQETFRLDVYYCVSCEHFVMLSCKLETGIIKGRI